MSRTGECVRLRVIGFRARSDNGWNTYLFDTNCRDCDRRTDPMRETGKPCVDAYGHAYCTVDNWRSIGHRAQVEPVYAEVDLAADAERDPADRLVDAINTYVQLHADGDDPSSWTTIDGHRRYTAAVRGIRATRTGEREVTVTAPNTDEGRTFGYMAAQLIDGPCEDVDPTGDIFRLDTAHIATVVDRQKYTFRW